MCSRPWVIAPSPLTVTAPSACHVPPVHGDDGDAGVGRTKKLRVPPSALPFESVALIWEAAIGAFVMSAFGAENDNLTIALPLTFAMLIDENVEELRARMCEGLSGIADVHEDGVDRVAAVARSDSPGECTCRCGTGDDRAL